ncbi:uncharacterized protein KY384_002638 [Bacidia gigantensis]|uniref:uncharacterized protein n=1 Tax=Bacidia gigantensis TaxID=2732470 RepID=UPI001D054940|nr:uncharacterized protein KY384_002638 [Bacidia gigantensis]KAG8532760.1 hypothetical protein KY384_002638 [Bacidia gigantensis]
MLLAQLQHVQLLEKGYQESRFAPTRKLCPYIQKSQSRSDLSPAFANDLQPVTDEAVGDGEKLADETKARSNDHSSQLQTREEGQLLRISGSCDNQLGSPTSSIPQKGIATLQVSSKGKDPGSLVQSMFDATPWDFERDSHKNEKAPAVADQVSLSSLTYGRRSNSMDYKRLGRTDYFLSHTCGPGENEVHSLDVGHFLCGKIRSCDEILRRFVVEFGRAKTACVKYSSINFLLIVKYLSRSRCVVSHPQSVFSCLWVNAKSLYVTNPTFSSAQAAARRFQPIPNSSISPLEQREELSEVEIAHIAKVILATLVASVRIPSLEAWVAVQKLRKSGHIALPAPSGDPPIPAEVISLTLEMLDAFDNDLAHALIVRLCTAVACRYHVENLHRQIELGETGRKAPARKLARPTRA